MAAQRVRASKAPSTAPRAAGAELATADEFLFAAVEAFVAFAVVLAGEGFAAYCTDERSFVGMGPQMRAEVVCTRKAFGTEVALECGGVFLDASGVLLTHRGPGGIGEVEEVAAVGHRGCGGAPHRPGGGRGAAGAGLIGCIEWGQGTVALIWTAGGNGRYGIGRSLWTGDGCTVWVRSRAVASSPYLCC